MAEEEQPQKQLESEQGLLQGFGGLYGIEPPRDVQPSQTNNTLNKLLEIERKLINTYKPERGQHFDIYQDFYSQLKKELSTFPLTEDDLTSLILAKANSDYNLAQSQMLGMYTGMLLQLLTERNNAEEKRTIFYINGEGRRFDYLFLFARYVDEVIVDNFVGNNICHNIANRGSANKVIAMNIKGDGTLLWCGGNSITINQIIGINLEGSRILSPSFSLSWVNQAIAVNIDIKEDPAIHLKHYARYGQVVCIDIKGRFYFSSSNNLLNKYPNINQLVCDNVSSISKKPCCQQLISLEDYRTSIRHPFIMLSQRSKLKKTIELARSLKDTGYPKVLEIADELYALRHKAPERFYRRTDSLLRQAPTNLERQICNGV